ncbi:Putative metallocarboxypeptidase ecm14 [Pseudogymnoascus verrucosus]|uniref:Inactive metallocarboxypeptidase ECM14 n=1 Tax=Pseudogymnoascus verrucosus TaxID=342668 RepID=A0A1B8GDG7_9PEZI|nr:Putative metallocarboxypeptidase ecm14 [Pseudogymnoascus verrucosus]OBT93871.1 Putative metallocarboxypeptidase ecm14 [Pseudogymnoascus verrucosus]
MRLLQEPTSLLPLLLLSTLAPVPTIAVPWATGDSTQSLSGRDAKAAAAPYHRSHSVFPQLTWLRDTAIEKIFGGGGNAKTDTTTTKQENGQTAATSQRRPLSAQLPATLLAKYGGDVVLRFNITTEEEEAALAEAADTLFLDVWEFTNNWADIRLAEDDVPSLLGLLPKSLHNAYSNLMPDLAQSIYQSYPSLAFSSPPFPPSAGHSSFTPSVHKTDGATDNIFFRDYQPLSVIIPWMRLMASMFTTHVTMTSIGLSYEGRSIPALRVGVHPTPASPSSKRKTIIIAGGLHAREWISTSSVTYIAWSLITAYGKSPAITKLIHEFDWVFIPTLNPDGYVYTWETDRLWRKNRQQTHLRFCRGLDLDRSFGYRWAGSAFQANPCSESYPGSAPFQAVESHRLAEWAKTQVEENNAKFVGLLDLHSYSQQVLYPYSYSCEAEPPTIENLEELGMGLAKAIRISSGEFYQVTSACEGSVVTRKGKGKGKSAKTTAKSAKSKKKDEEKEGPMQQIRMESGGGSAIDWFYHEMKVRYTYQLKLRDTGSYGFLLPGEHIVPTGEESFNAVKYFGDFLMGNKGIESVDGVEVEGEVEVGGEGSEEEGVENVAVEEGEGEDVDKDDDEEWVVVENEDTERAAIDMSELRRRRR